MVALAVSSPAAHRAGSQVCIDGHDIDLRVTKEPVDNVLPGRPQPGFKDDAQLDADRGRHKPGKSILEIDRKLLASRLGGWSYWQDFAVAAACRRLSGRVLNRETPSSGE